MAGTMYRQGLLVVLGCSLGCSSGSSPARPPSDGGAPADGPSATADAPAGAADAPDAAAGSATRLAAAIKTNDLVVDEEAIYLLDPAGDPDTRVVRMSKLDGTQTVLASGIRLAANLRADDTDLYFDAQGAIQSIPRRGGAVRTVTGARSLGALAGERLYWIETSSGTLKHPEPPVLAVFSVPKTGGAPERLLTEMEGGGDRVIADATGLYFQAGDELQLLRHGASQPTTLATLATGFISALALDQTHAFYGLGDGSLMKVSKQGGAPSRIAGVQGFPLGVALDATHVYFTDTEAGTVGRVAKSGGAPEVLAREQARPVAIAVDAASVYWVNINDGTLMKRAK